MLLPLHEQAAAERKAATQLAGREKGGASVTRTVRVTDNTDAIDRSSRETTAQVAKTLGVPERQVQDIATGAGIGNSARLVAISRRRRTGAATTARTITACCNN